MWFDSVVQSENPDKEQLRAAISTNDFSKFHNELEMDPDLVAANASSVKHIHDQEVHWAPSIVKCNDLQI